MFSEKGGPCEVATAVQIAEVVAVGVCLALEGYVAIGSVVVAVLHQPYKPFQDIDNVERDEQHLAHLRRVDSLVVDHMEVNPPGVARPECAEEIYTNPFRHNSAANDFRFNHSGGREKE